MVTRSDHEPTEDPRLAAPLTERILIGLPGPRIPWIIVWALVPWLNLAVIVAFDAAPWVGSRVPVLEVLNRAAVSFAVVLTLWGTARVAGQLRRLRGNLSDLVQPGDRDIDRAFGGVGNIVVPLLLICLVAAVLPVDEALAGQPEAAMIQAVTWLVIGVPLATAFWVYVTLQIGLNRLGRGGLTIQPYRGDRSLGLRPIGSLAFSGFWMLFGGVAPLVLTGLSDLPVVLVGGAVLATVVGLFFVSLRRLNRQMVVVKRGEVDRALDLYMQAYRNVQDDRSLEALERHVGLLNAAEVLEKRAERIQEWPFDEATFARVVTIASSVAAVIIARLILNPVGL